jgi:uncharacterized membrane protein
MGIVIKLFTSPKVNVGMAKSVFIIYVQGIFYLIAGLNHFINPDFYLPLIPDYLPWHTGINILSGIFELILGAGLLLKATRMIAGILILLMLLAFIPSHIHFIHIGSCVDGGLCVPSWLAWARLILIHPLLMLWAYMAAFQNRSISYKI